LVDPVAFIPDDVDSFDIDSAATGAAGLDIYITLENSGSGGGGGGSITVEEEDGDPSVSDVDTIKVTNGTLTDNGDGSVSVEIGSGGVSISSDTYSNLPAAGSEGNIFLPTDGVTLEYDTGAVWTPWGSIFPFTRPVLADFTWVNQGTATAVEDAGGIYLHVSAETYYNHRILKKNTPSTPYIITAIININAIVVDYFTAGLIWRENSSGKLITIGLYSISGQKFYIRKWNNPTTWAGDYLNLVDYSSGLIHLQLEDDGSNRIIRISRDGMNFITVHSVGRTDFLTADEVGIYASPQQTTYDIGLHLLSWKEE